MYEKIHQELKQLSQRQLELSKAHEQRVKSHEEQKTLYQHLFGQQSLQPDPELESVKEDKRRLYDILQAAASIPPPVPVVDWSNSPIYWKRLTKYGLITPGEQLQAFNLFAAGMVGLGYASSNFYRAHHLFELTHCKEKK